MNTRAILFYTVVLWAVADSRHVYNREERSLDVEDKGRNLTEKLPQEEIHTDVLQHVTLASTSTQAAPQAILPEDILGLEDRQVQSLKSENSLRAFYRKEHEDFSVETDKKTRTKEIDITSHGNNETDTSNNKKLDILKFENEHSSTKINKERDHKEKLASSLEFQQPAVSNADSLKDNLERKSVETKKKEKGKKEFLETVPTNHSKLDKPLKDNVISKLKEKNRDLISDALDEQRSTIRFSNRSSISLRVNDNINDTLDSSDIFKDNPSDENSELSVNQNLNSVITGNGVISDSVKRSRVEKRTQDIANDTKSENSSASENHLVEDAVRNIFPAILGVGSPTTPVMVPPDSTNSGNFVPVSTFLQPSPTDSTPTKIDIFGKLGSPSTTSLVKQSNSFKQQVTNKLKGLESSTVLTVSDDDLVEENLEKSSGKLPTKISLKKKSKPEFFIEMNIPATATSWTLVSLKAAAEDFKTNHNNIDVALQENAYSSSTTEPALAQQQTTTTAATRVNNFVSWSTRLLKGTTTNAPPTSFPIDKIWPQSPKTSGGPITLEHLSSSDSTLLVTTGEPNVIRTTEELDRDLFENINSVHASLHDIMIRDQSSTKSHDIVTSTQQPVVALQSVTLISKEENPSNNSVGLFNYHSVENENLIETTRTPDLQKVSLDTLAPKLKENRTSFEKIDINITEKTNEVLSTDSSDRNKDIKTSFINESSNFVLTISSTTPTPSIVDEPEGSKNKSISDSEEFDNAFVDILEAADDSKSQEEDDDEEKTTQMTTLPMFDPLETTISELDEEDEDEKFEEDSNVPDKAEKQFINNSKTETTTEINKIDITTSVTNKSNLNPGPTLPIKINKPQITTERPIEFESTTTETHVRSSSTRLPIVSPTESVIIPIMTDKEILLSTPVSRPNGSYVTSVDIISKDNTTQKITKTPSQGDLNWYEIVSKPISNDAEKTKTNGKLPLETTLNITAKTVEPETTTEISKQETTISPDTTEGGTSQSTTTEAVTNPPSIEQEEIDLETEKEDACVRISVSVREFCQKDLRKSIALGFESVHISPEQVILRKTLDCHKVESRASSDPASIQVCFIDKNQDPSPLLKEMFQRRSMRGSDVKGPADQGFDNVFAAIILSVIAAVCLVLLGILLIIVRKRQGRFNYGQRCTPVSLDDYSLDNISVYNSVRRKGNRASKRSYGNPAFDDPGSPTHSVNFAGLANFSSDRQALDEEFSQIPVITVKPDELPPGAENKNRYANVIPLPETRVPLHTKDGSDVLDDYINANYVKAPKSQEKLYIACQAPLQSTVEDFWRMVWQQQSKVILMLTALTENGVEKCADYLPQLEVSDCHRVFGDFQVTLKKHEVREKYIISTLQLKNIETNLWREVTHLWYSSWPAQGVPEEGSSLIAFLIEARSYARGVAGPSVVHCSPGTGRTGTVIAIDLCIRDFETLRTVDIPRTVYSLRRDRAGSVQTKDQYAFIYQVLNLYATKLTGGGMDSI